MASKVEIEITTDAKQSAADINDLADEINAAETRLIELNQALIDNARASGDTSEKIKEIKNAIAAVKDEIRGYNEILKITEDRQSRAGASADQASNRMKGLGDATRTLDDSFTAALTPSLQSFGTLLGGTVNPAIVGLAATAGILVISFKALSAGFKFITENSAKAGAEWEKLQGIFDKVSKAVAEALGGPLGAGLENIRILIEQIIKYAAPAFEELTKSFKNYGRAISSPDVQRAIKELGKALGELFAQIGQEGFGALAAGITTFAELFARHGPQIIRTLTKILDIVMRLIDALSRASSTFNALVSAGGVGLAIPGFQHGVTNFSGGLAVVGEREPETLILPRGASVLPDGGALARGAGAVNFYGSVTFAIQGGTRLTLEDFNRQVRQQAFTAGANR